MPFTPGHTSSSGSRLQPLTPAELSKMNKPDLNRERNALLAELAVAREALDAERERHAEIVDGMNESIYDLSMRLGHVHNPEEPLTLDLADSNPDPEDGDDPAPAAAQTVAKPEPVTIHEMKRVLGISDEEHNDILRDMHIAYHNSRLNPALPWSKQDLNNTLSYIEAMNGISSRLARAKNYWASEFLAQQYGQNWRKQRKHHRAARQ